MTIEQLRLSPNAKRAAQLIAQQFPSIVFTSGRRDPRGQARAMARNVMQDRAWLLKTYKDSRMRQQLQQYVNLSPEQCTVSEMTDGLYQVMLAMPDGDLMRLSRHLTGDAWDAQWPADDREGEAICQAIEALPPECWFDKVLRREGHLKIIHAQFLPSVDV